MNLKKRNPSLRRQLIQIRIKMQMKMVMNHRKTLIKMILKKGIQRMANTLKAIRPLMMI